MKDLRQYLEELSKDHPEEVKREVDPKFEITTLLYKLEERGLFPLTIFENVKDLKGKLSGIRVISNVFATRGKIARALDLPRDQWKMELTARYQQRRDNPLKPVIVIPQEAPVKERVLLGDDANLLDLPIVTHHEMDAGPYLTMAVVAKDPDTGVYNSSFQRMMVVGPRDTGISIAPRHLWDYYVRYERRNQPMPIAVVLGHHPAFCLGTMASIPIEADEYEVIGGLLHEPLRLTPSATWGEELLIPADAEIVLEGEVLPKIRRAEAPFGEFTGYYGAQRLNPVVRVTAINMRHDPILQTIFIGHQDGDYLIAVPMEGDVFNAIRPYVPTVKAVYIPPSGKTYNCYISIEKRFEGAGKLAAVAAIPVHDFIKHVFVVDDDIDIYREEEVLFAFATRCQGDEDIDMVRGIRGNILDPSATRSPLWTNIIIDATKPINRPFELRINVPRETYDRIDLNEFIGEEELAKLTGRRG